MGGSSSKSQFPPSCESHAPAPLVRLTNDRIGPSYDSQSDLLPSESLIPLLKTGFAGTWSTLIPTSPHPCQRIGHFSVFSEERNSLFVGYGLTQKNISLNDVWELDLKNYIWRKIKLNGDVITPRAYSSACIEGSSIFVFGGLANNVYIAGLHVIDANTGMVTMLETTEDVPSPRSSPIMGVHKGNLFVWGGYDGTWPAFIHQLDIDSLVWTSMDPGFSGRYAIPTAIYENKLYGYGCSKNGGFLVIDLNDGTESIKKGDGAIPPSEYMSAGMVIVDKYLLYFGGKTEDEYSLVYACSLNKMRWFVFWIVPDGETVSHFDGHTDETGIFHLPRMYGFSAAYSHANRQVITCFGYPEKDPFAFNIFSIGEALSILHLRDDMLDTLTIHR